jgi:hypothetical protein
LEKHLRRNALGAECHVIRRAIIGRSRAACEQPNLITCGAQAISQKPDVGFGATLPAIPIGHEQNAH